MTEITITLTDGSVFKESYDNLIKIEYFNQLFDNRDYEEIKELSLSNLTEMTLDIILNFLKIENEEIRAFIKSIEQVSSYDTSRMPVILVEFLERFNITNDKNHNKMIINNLIKLKEDCNYLQYDLLGDAIEYKWADNYRIMDRCLLKEILTENVHDVCNDLYKETDEIFINDFDCKFQPIILHHYQIDEDIIDDVLKQKIENPLKGVSLNQFNFKEILMSNVNELLEELNYLT